MEEPAVEVVMTISLPCTVTSCAYMTMKLDPVVAASVLSSHTLGVHKDPVPTPGRRAGQTSIDPRLQPTGLQTALTPRMTICFGTSFSSGIDSLEEDAAEHQRRRQDVNHHS